MYLYHLTLQKPSGITQCCVGNFSGAKTQEFLVARGNTLELYKLDESGKLQSVIAVNIFGIVRSIAPFRLTGGSKDYVIVGSDSGRTVILEYNPTKNVFDKVHQETYGKSGIRRIVPGQYLATDPKGRAAMIGAVEKQKLVYILNRDSAARLTISSPLEAHRPHSVTYSMCGVDVGFENPIFACIEQEYENSEGPQKELTFYELDLGLNHVVRKWSDTIDSKSNMLIPVPGGSDGPGGVIICAENYLVYRNQGHAEVRAAIPRRRGFPRDHGLLIVSATAHKQKDIFFVLAQSELGDLYKVTLSYEEDIVNEVKISYFDTVPPATSMCVHKTGLLFVAAEAGNHVLYQFQSLGEEDDAMMEVADTEEPWSYFDVHPLKNLSPIDELENFSPMLDFKIADLAGEETPQIYGLCGRGVRSSLKISRHGLAVSEMAVSPLPGNPSAVWTVRKTLRDPFDKYIVVSFVNATLVLAIGETVEEATDSGFLGNAPTLHAANIGEDSILQIHPNGIRHIRADKRVHEWKTPGKKTIVHATSNERQVAIALSGGDILYFELDEMGQLLEVEKKFMGIEIACLAIAPIPEGRQRSRFLAVGDWDNTVRVFSLDTDNCLQALCVQGVPTHPESLCIVSMTGSDGSATMFLNIGLNNGVHLRSVLDAVTGELSDTRTRFLGSRPVKLFNIRLKGNNALLALSSRSWMCYYHQSRYWMTPLSYATLDYAANFASEQCAEGIVAIAANTLRIITLERLGEVFNTTEIPLTHTPRKFVVHPTTNQLVVVESDHNALTMEEKKQFYSTYGLANDVNSILEYEKHAGEPRPGPGRWATSVRLLDVVENKTMDLIDIGDNEAATCMCSCYFLTREQEPLIVVGTAKDMTLHPMSSNGGFLHVYRVVDGKQLQLLHKTPIEMAPTALCAFQGKLLVGLGKFLRIYELGKKKLLRKCENRSFPNHIINIQTQGDRIYVGDVQESVIFAKYKRSENLLYIFADEQYPRWLTSFQVLDYDTVTGADKFGNVFVSRLPAQVSDEVEDDPTGGKLSIEMGYLNGASHRLEDVAAFYTGDTVTSIQKTSLVPGGAEAIVYSTMMGGLGAFLPFTSREDVDFFSHLEMHLRQENPPLCGREHLSYRSYYFPVKNVLDGDLCETFALVDPEKQRSIAEELDRSPSEVMKKLEDIRNRLL